METHSQRETDFIQLIRDWSGVFHGVCSAAHALLDPLLVSYIVGYRMQHWRGKEGEKERERDREGIMRLVTLGGWASGIEEVLHVFVSSLYWCPCHCTQTTFS